MYDYINTHIFISMYIFLYEHVYMYMYICIFILIHAYIYTHLGMYIIFFYVFLYIYTCDIIVYICIYIYIYTHKHIYVGLSSLMDASGSRKNVRKYVCLVCKEQATEPCAAKCGHICCENCWKRYAHVNINLYQYEYVHRLI
jgi:hypothetical protein